MSACLQPHSGLWSYGSSTAFAWLTRGPAADMSQTYQEFPEVFASGFQLGLDLANNYNLKVAPEYAAGPVRHLLEILSDHRRELDDMHLRPPSDRMAIELLVANVVLAAAARQHHPEQEALTSDQLREAVEWIRRLLNDLFPF